MNQPPSSSLPQAVRDRRLTMCATFRDVFSAEECQRIIDQGTAFGLEAGVVREADLDASLRDSRIARFGQTAETAWIFDRLFDLVGRMNRENWRFELAGAEALQLASYGVGGHYDWHLDIGVGFPFTMRKVTVSVQLSDPAEYQGGALETLYGLQSDIAPRDRGTLVMFPSYILHRVQPVTSGSRYSLNAWIHGEAPFR